MSGEPWSKFFWKDWESDPALKLCGLAAQGLWMRLLCIAAASTVKGEVRIGRRPCSTEDISRIINCSVEELSGLLDELEAKGVFDRAADGAIVSRRMVRDAADREKARAYGKRGGRPKSLKENEDQDNPSLLENEKGGVLDVFDGSPPDPLPLLPPTPPNNSLPSPPTPNFVVPRARDGFAEWWGEYPHRVGKRDAERAYRGALQRADSGELLSGLVRYVAGKPRDRPWCNPATWLNQDRWLDEPAEQLGRTESGNGKQSPVEKLYAGAYLAAQDYEREHGDSRDCDSLVVPLLDWRRSH